MELGIRGRKALLSTRINRQLSAVAGLACGEGGNGYGIAGAGYRCDLLIYKSDLFNASIAESINWVPNRNLFIQANATLVYDTISTASNLIG